MTPGHRRWQSRLSWAGRALSDLCAYGGYAFGSPFLPTVSDHDPAMDLLDDRLTSIPPGHPERLVPHVPLSPVERMLRDQLIGP